ncbi:metallophosphoesterase [Candidatus Woesearchaeota archaeon]|nr:metallophosphoesterase [Candidatus Woesearchaeota archaeon]
MTHKDVKSQKKVILQKNWLIHLLLLLMIIPAITEITLLPKQGAFHEKPLSQSLIGKAAELVKDMTKDLANIVEPQDDNNDNDNDPNNNNANSATQDNDATNIQEVEEEPPSLSAVGDVPRGPYLQRPKANEMMVIWQSLADEPGEVRYGLTPSYGNVVASQRTYLPEQNVYLHEATLPNLQQDKTYYYKVMLNGNTIVEASFSSQRSPGSNFSFIVFGDSGDAFGDTEHPQYLLAKVMEEDRVQRGYDFMLHTGDIVYDSGRQEDYNMNYFDPYANISLSVPMFPSLGNHDIVTEDGQPYVDNFYLPNERLSESDPASTEKYYAFEYGDALLIALDTNEDYHPGSPQFLFLLSNLNRTDQQWKIVYFHHPAYASDSAYHSTDLDVRETLTPLFSFFGVDLVFNGHQHFYERMEPINGVQYIVTGGGGRSLYTPGEQNPYSEVLLEKYHYIGVSGTPRTLNLTTIGLLGVRLDNLTITTQDSVVVFDEGMLSEPHKHELYPFYPVVVYISYRDAYDQQISDGLCTIETPYETVSATYKSQFSLEGIFGFPFNVSGYTGTITTQENELLTYTVTCEKSGHDPVTLDRTLNFSSQYPGIKEEPYGEKTGFYHIEQLENRLWFINPMGQRVFLSGMSSIVPGYFDESYYEQQYPTIKSLVSSSVSMLSSISMNMIGHASPLGWFQGYFPITPNLEFLGNFEEDADVWSPSWEANVVSIAQSYGISEDINPLIVGYYISNEPFNGIETGYFHAWIQNTMDNNNSQGKPMPYAKQAYVDGMIAQYQELYPGEELAKLNTFYNLSERENAIPGICSGLLSFSNFQELFGLPWDCLYEDLYRTVNGTVLKYPSTFGKTGGPERLADLHHFNRLLVRKVMTTVDEAMENYTANNHMNLGYKSAIDIDPEAMEEQMKFADVFSIDYYQRMDYEYYDGFPFSFRDHMEKWYALAKKPVLIAEFSYLHKDWEKCSSEGYPIAENQSRRGEFYQRYMNESIKYPFVLGAVWYSYIDSHFSLENRELNCDPDDCYMNFGLLAGDNYSSYNQSDSTCPDGPYDVTNLPNTTGVWEELYNAIKDYNPTLQDRAALTTMCMDGDNDGYESGICGGLDCDDFDNDTHPGATEDCNDGIDNDCNQAVDGNDSVCKPEETNWELRGRNYTFSMAQDRGILSINVSERSSSKQIAVILLLNTEEDLSLINSYENISTVQLNFSSSSWVVWWDTQLLSTDLVQTRMNISRKGTYETVPEGMTTAVIYTSSMPFKTLASFKGPHGIFPSEAVQMTSIYPKKETYLPGVGMFNESHGIIIAPTGQELLTGKRYYKTHVYNGTDEASVRARIIPQDFNTSADDSGLVSVTQDTTIITYIIEPFYLPAIQEPNPLLVDAKNEYMITQWYTAVLSTTPRTVQVSVADEEGNFASLLDATEVLTEEELNDLIVNHVTGVELSFSDINSSYDSCGHYIGIGCAFLGGLGPSPEKLSHAQALKAAGLKVVAYNSVFEQPYGSFMYNYLDARNCIAKDKDGNPFNAPATSSNGLLNTRNASCRKFVVDKLVNDIQAYGDSIDGYRFDVTWPSVVTGQLGNGEIYNVSYEGGIAQMWNELIPALRAAKPDIILGWNFEPRLMVPNEVDVYGIGDGGFGYVDPQEFLRPNDRQRIVHGQQLTDALLINGFGTSKCENFANAGALNLFALRFNVSSVSVPFADPFCSFDPGPLYHAVYAMSQDGGYTTMDEKVFHVIPQANPYLPAYGIQELVILAKMKTAQNNEWLLISSMNASSNITYENVNGTRLFLVHNQKNVPYQLQHTISPTGMTSIQTSIEKDSFIVAEQSSLHIIPSQTIVTNITQWNDSKKELWIQSVTYPVEVKLNLSGLRVSANYTIVLSDASHTSIFDARVIMTNGTGYLTIPETINEESYLIIQEGNTNITRNCQLLRAFWSQFTAAAGEMVNISVATRGCTGYTLTFEIVEDDLIGEDPVNTNPLPMSITQENVSTSWITEWQYDGLFDPDPEYYIVATIMENDSLRITSPQTKEEELTVTSTDSEDPLAITEINVKEMTFAQVMINWSTNKPANGSIRYGNESGIYTWEQTNSTLDMNQTLVLNNLAKNTIYYYVITAATNTEQVNSSEGNFTTSTETVYTNGDDYEQLNVTVSIDGSNVTFRMPVIYATSPAIENVVIHKPLGWENGFAWSVHEGQESNERFGRKDVVDLGENLSWTANLSQTNVWLYFSVPAPTLRIDGVSNNGTHYTKNFTVLGANSIVNISGNVSLNTSFPYYVLKWWNLTNWEEANMRYSFQVAVEQNMSFLSNIEIDNTHRATGQSFSITSDTACNRMQLLLCSYT